MKEKMKKFFIEKKELLIFIGVVVFVFAAVIGIASLAINSSNNTEDATPPVDNTPQEPANTNDDNNQEEPVVAKKFALPVAGEYNVVRTYFDSTLAKEELEAAVIIDSNGALITSTGVSYAKNDNSSFDVLAIYDGTVVNVITDELAGATIEIDHGNNVISVYSSLKDVNVKLGDTITQGTQIAKASDSINDTDAKVHLHLQVKVNDKFINPNSIFGKEIIEFVDMK